MSFFTKLGIIIGAMVLLALLAKSGPQPLAVWLTVSPVLLAAFVVSFVELYKLGWYWRDPSPASHSQANEVQE